MNDKEISELMYQFERNFYRTPDIRMSPSKTMHVVTKLAENCKAPDKAEKIIFVLLANTNPHLLKQTLRTLESMQLL